MPIFSNWFVLNFKNLLFCLPASLPLGSVALAALAGMDVSMGAYMSAPCYQNHSHKLKLKQPIKQVLLLFSHLL